MKEYNETKALRLRYPVELTEDQMSEIIAALPIKPERDDMVSLGLSHGHEFTQKEIILYWMYQEKLVKGISTEFSKELKDLVILNERKALARSQGGVLNLYVKNVLKNDGAKNDIDFEKKKELAKQIFLTWKSGTPKGLFKLQLVGYKNIANINLKIFGKTEENDFLFDLIK